MKNLVYILLFVSALGFAQNSDVLVFAPKGGLHNKPVDVVLSSNLTNARIYYTLDGSDSGFGSMRYTKLIAVKNIAVIRAIAFGDGERSEIITNSYFCDREYSLPVVSIATNPANLWDFATGIYVKGCCADTVQPYLGANFWKDWEKRANIEMYETDGTQAFNQLAGIGVFGGFSKGLPQKSLYVTARSKYGKKNFAYPIFPARKMKKYKSFLLRNSGGDFGKTQFRDAFMTQLAKPTGIAIQEYRPAIVFLNGEYWGIQNLREKINEHYLEDVYKVNPDNVDLMEHRDGAKHGNSKAYRAMLAWISKTDLSVDENVNQLNKVMNIEDYMNYNIAEIYSDNRDAGGNIRYWKERNDSSRWRWILYDTDMGLGNNNPNGYKNNTLKKFTSVNNEIWPDPPWSTFIIRSLLSNKQLETDYINRFADQLNTVYHSDTAVRLVNKMADAIREEIPFHQKKWGTSTKAWEDNVAVLRKFADRRPYYLRQFIMEKFSLTDTVNVSVAFPGQEVCDITLNSLKLKRDFKGIYFKNVPVKITAEPNHDYEFVGWKDRTEKTNELTVMLSNDITLVPIFRVKPKSRYADSVLINEICFYQHKEDTSGDWVESYNYTTRDIDLGGWVFTESSYKKGFVVPSGTVIPAQGFIVIAEALENYISCASELIGGLNFGLSKKGESLKLYDVDGLIVDSLRYAAADILSDENTFSISLVHPDSMRYSPTAWQKENPSPGQASLAYEAYLKAEEEKAYWTKTLFIGGGSFFFILVVGRFFYRYSKKKRALTNKR